MRAANGRYSLDNPVCGTIIYQILLNNCTNVKPLPKEPLPMSRPLDPHDNNTERVCISMHTRDLARIDRAANEIGERSRSKFCRGEHTNHRLSFQPVAI
jgi:hypothetical protein